jgi:hypothetical protein
MRKLPGASEKEWNKKGKMKAHAKESSAPKREKDEKLFWQRLEFE